MSGATPTCELSPGFSVAVRLQQAQDRANTFLIIQLHLVFAALVDDISQGGGSSLLYLVTVRVQQLQKLRDPIQQRQLAKNTNIYTPVVSLMVCVGNTHYTSLCTIISHWSKL